MPARRWECAKLAPTSTLISWESPKKPLQQILEDKQINLHSLSAFQTAVFALGPRASECLPESFKRRISKFSIALWVSWKPCSFSEPDILQARLSSISQCKSQGLGCLTWGINPLLLRKKLCICEIPSNCGLSHQGLLARPCLCLLFFSMWPFYPLL